jgi:hypothetical protein
MRTRTRFAATSMALTMTVLVAAAPVQAVTGWTGPNRVVADDSPISPSAVLANGVYHVAYLHEKPVGGDEANGIFYASNSGGAWHRERVTTGDDFYARPSLAIDDAGHAFIAFGRVCFTCDPVTSSIILASNRSGAWHTHAITRGNADLDPSLVFSDGILHLAFARREQGVRYGTNAGGVWHFKLVAQTAGSCPIDQYPSLGVGADGDVWIALEQPRFTGPCRGRSSGIGVLHGVGGTWTTETVSTNRNDDLADLVIDSANLPHLVFQREGVGIEYARRSGAGDWSHPALVGDGNDATLVVDTAANAHVAYEGHGGVTYATDASGPFVETTLAPYSIDYGTSSPVQVLLSPSGKARVFYARSEGNGSEDSGLYLAKQQ